MDFIIVNILCSNYREFVWVNEKLGSVMNSTSSRNAERTKSFFVERKKFSCALPKMHLSIILPNFHTYIRLALNWNWSPQLNINYSTNSLRQLLEMSMRSLSSITLFVLTLTFKSLACPSLGPEQDVTWKFYYSPSNFRMYFEKIGDHSGFRGYYSPWPAKYLVYVSWDLAQ